MVTIKSREQAIFDKLNDYKFRYNPTSVFLIVKAELMDIMQIERKNFSQNHRTLLSFTEEQLYSFKMAIIDVIKKKDITGFMSKYWLKKNEFDFELYTINKNNIIAWWLRSGICGDTFFSKPGAIIVRDVDDYWLIILFSFECLTRKNIDAELKGIDDLLIDI